MHFYKLLLTPIAEIGNIINCYVHPRVARLTNEQLWYRLYMDVHELDLTFIPAPDDAPLKSEAYQAELQQFEHGLTAHGLEVSSTIELRESWAPEPSITVL